VCVCVCVGVWVGGVVCRRKEGEMKYDHKGLHHRQDVSDQESPAQTQVRLSVR